LKEIDRVVNPATEIIMRFGATVAEAKAGASPEFLTQSARALPTTQCTTRSSAYPTSPPPWPPRRPRCRDVATVSIGGAPIKIAMLVDPQGNALEIMELPKTLTHLPH